ncbi:MAG: chemotaxis protein CheW [Micropepsaceae bacterium]
MDDVLREFLTEAFESIEALDTSLVQFEKHPDNPALLGEIFRVMHTIKGTCGFLNLPRLERIAHAGENVLGLFRDGVLAPTPASVGPILMAIDTIKHLLNVLDRTGQEEAGGDEVLLARLAAAEAGEFAEAASAGPAQAAELPSLDELGGLATLDAAAEIMLRVLADTCFFAARATQEDLDLAAGFSRDALAAILRNEKPGSAFVAALARALPGASDVSVVPTVLAALDGALEELGVEPAARDALAVFLEPGGAAQPVQRSEGVPSAPVPLPPQSPVSPPPQAETAAAAAPAKSAEDSAGSASSQTIRVSVDALEQLMNVVSELVLIRNQLLQTSRQIPDSPFAAPLQRLNHVTTELQESVMTTRMQPIGNAWQKLPRIVRDLAVELGKKIDLEMLGAETELDRQVLELIKDPLTHMIRNAADHGLEGPEERRAAGKPDTGRVLLQARHEGGHIVVEISDDGRGLPLARLRQKAVDNGLMSRAEADAAPNAQIQQLIFHAGLSTAAAVTNVSGRGVGMDVVRTNIEKIGGTIELASREGAGTRFTIRIPLTLTIVSALIVESAGRRFAMPQSSVLELVGTNPSSRNLIEYLNGAPVLRLRDRLLPLISLQNLLKLPPADDQPVEGCIMVTQIGSFSFGIIVDRVFDTEEIVVKPVARVLKHIPLFSGNTILGDGSVIMILDPKGIAAETGRIDTSAGEHAFADRRQPPSEHHPILVVRYGGDRWKAVPLSLVARIEELEAGRVEAVDGRKVLQYRGRLIPVMTIDDAPLEFAAGGATKPVLVFENNGRDFALVVDDILDIVDQSLVTQLEPASPGRLGSLIVSGRAADLLDIGHYWSAIIGSSRPARSEGPASILLVEPNPFFRRILQPLLASAGYAVTLAGSASEAQAIAASGQSFSLVLADTAEDVSDLKAQAFARSGDGGGIPPVVGLSDSDDDLAAGHSDAFAALANKHDRRNILRAIRAASAPAGRAA